VDFVTSRIWYHNQRQERHRKYCCRSFVKIDYRFEIWYHTNHDYFPDESLLSVSILPWFANIINFLVSGQLPAHWNTKDKRKFLNEVKNFYWDDPYLFKYCPDQIFRRCISDNEVSSVIKFCHSEACGGHFSSRKTTAKILQSRFYWPTMFKDSHAFCKTCENCQKLGSISKHHMMPLNPILVIEIFDYWGYRFHGSISSIIWFLVHISRNKLCFKMDRGNSKLKQWSQNNDKVFERKYFELVWNPSSHDKWWWNTFLQQVISVFNEEI